MNFSDFGNKFRVGTGIGTLMHDLANVPNDGRPLYRLGGGNPAQIPAAAAAFDECFRNFNQRHSSFGQLFDKYPASQGHTGFIDSLVTLLNAHYGWQLNADNIAITNGSQNAFFMLFNLFGGRTSGNNSVSQRRILLPLAPEYIGYEDVSIGGPLFVSNKPIIDRLGSQRFKYRLDTGNLDIDDSIAALCVSRPTNPTGNVLSDAELDTLDTLALQHNIPLIIDNAYGAPFPDIMHVPATLRWHENIILSMSLSKLGLPAARTGIVIAQADIIRIVTEMNAVMNLSPGSIATSILQPMFESGEVLDLCEQHIRPFYQQRAQDALDWFSEFFDGLPALAHEPEGSIFLWLWFPELPITAKAFYRRLKDRGVVVVPGEYFFPGIEQDWPHKHQCIRVNIAGDALEIKTGLSLIADELRETQQRAA